jgi:DNA polymerase-3 subunit alpha
MVGSVEKKFTKKDGRPFAVIQIEDFTGQIEMMAWDEVYTKNAALLVPGTVIQVSAKLSVRDEAVRAIAGAMTALKPKSSARPVLLKLARRKLSESDLPNILEVVKKHPGKRPLLIEIINDHGASITLQAGDDFSVGDERAILDAVGQFAG